MAYAHEPHLRHVHVALGAGEEQRHTELVGHGSRLGLGHRCLAHDVALVADEHHTDVLANVLHSDRWSARLAPLHGHPASHQHAQQRRHTSFTWFIHIVTLSKDSRSVTSYTSAMACDARHDGYLSMRDSGESRSQRQRAHPCTVKVRRCDATEAVLASSIPDLRDNDAETALHRAFRPKTHQKRNSPAS
jgi:hypothetical protein